MTTATIDYEVIWTLNNSRPCAAELASKFAETWPAAAKAATDAYLYVDNGQVWRSGQKVPAGESLTDLWIVGKSNHSAGERCTHAGNTCTCNEQAAHDPKFGRLCSHRIAVMMYKKIQQANRDALIAMIRYLDTIDPDARVCLEVDRHYRPGVEDRKLVKRITRGPGGRGPHLTEIYMLEADDETIAAVMQATGRTLSGSPQKRTGWTYVYILAPVSAANPAGDPAIELRGVDATAKDNAADRRRQLYADGRALAAAMTENERRAA